MTIKKMEKKKLNYYHKSTLYIPVKCTMQQSVNGNIKCETTEGTETLLTTKPARPSPLPPF